MVAGSGRCDTNHRSGAATVNPTTASNAGRVPYAADLAIYGNCVVLDHGLGLASLYGHLASFAVAG